MKKILMASIVLTVFSIAVIIFQMSCQKETDAQTGSNYVLPAATTNTLGGVIVGTGLSVTNNGVLSLNSATNTGIIQLNKIIICKNYSASDPEIWIANYDGSNYMKINIALPAGVRMVTSTDVKLSPDGQTIFFNTSENNIISIYSCNINGSNLKKIISGGNGNTPFLRGVN